MFLFYKSDLLEMTTVNLSGPNELYLCYHRDCEQSGLNDRNEISICKSITSSLTRVHL